MLALKGGDEMDCTKEIKSCDVLHNSIGYKLYALLISYYLVVSSCFITYYKHDMNPDGTIYLSLAQKYLDGDVGNAVSGHWAPMISWLLLPFMSLGMDQVSAYRTVSILIGIFALIGIDRLMLEIEISNNTRVLYLAALIPVVAWYAEGAVGADMLCACLLLFYLKSIIQSSYQSNKYTGISVGALGALSYLAKNYNFYFFILHFICINVLYFIKASDGTHRKTLMLNFISGVIVFCLISGVWVGLISMKYSTFTVGTAGAYNFSHIRPGHSTNTHPMLTDGLMPPPNASAISVWEDPNYIKLVHWSPFRTVPDFIFYLNYITKNIYKYLNGLAVNYIIDVTIISVAVMLLVSKNTLNRKVRDIVITILLYPLGYFALYYDGQRYVLIVPILLYIINAYLIDSLFARYKKSKAVKVLIASVVCLSLIALTLVRVKRDYPELSEINEMYRVSASIDKYVNMEKANIASHGGDWYHTIDMSYFLRARYFGKTSENETDAQLRKELVDYKIKYLIVYGPIHNNIEYLNQ
jgi:hypothetical protein